MSRKVLQFQGQSQFHDSQQSKSKVGMQYSSQQNGPRYPTSYYHAKDGHQHMKDLQQTAQLGHLG